MRWYCPLIFDPYYSCSWKILFWYIHRSCDKFKICSITVPVHLSAVNLDKIYVRCCCFHPFHLVEIYPCINFLPVNRILLVWILLDWYCKPWGITTPISPFSLNIKMQDIWQNRFHILLSNTNTEFLYIFPKYKWPGSEMNSEIGANLYIWCWVIYNKSAQGLALPVIWKLQH